jgi:hypothetical protein
MLKCFIPGYKFMKLYLLSMSSTTKLILVVLRILLVSVYPLRKLETVPPLTSATPQVLAVQQGVPHLQFSWRLQQTNFSLSLLNLTAVYHHRMACLVSLSSFKILV